MTTKEVLEPLLKMDTKSVIELAAECYGDLLPLLAEIDPDYGGIGLVITIFSSAINVDGVISEVEYQFLDGFLMSVGQDMSREEITDLIRNYSGKEAEELVKALTLVCDADQRSALALLVSCICAIDKKFSKEEYQLIIDLIEG